MGPEFLTLLMAIPCNFISVLYKTAVAHRDLNNLCALLTSPHFFFFSPELSRAVFKQLIPFCIMARDNRAQVIVIGTGLSGLTAASELNHRGIDVLVLEASPNVGCRVNSATNLRSHLDLGGQWIGHGHHCITALVDKARGIMYQMFSCGLPTVVRKGHTVSLFSLSVLFATVWLVLLELASRI